MTTQPHKVLIADDEPAKIAEFIAMKTVPSSEFKFPS